MSAHESPGVDRYEPSDSAAGNPSYAQVEALLGEPDEPDWKNAEAVDVWLAPRLAAMAALEGCRERRG